MIKPFCTDIATTTINHYNHLLAFLTAANHQRLLQWPLLITGDSFAVEYQWITITNVDDRWGNQPISSQGSRHEFGKLMMIHCCIIIAGDHVTVINRCESPILKHSSWHHPKVKTFLSSPRDLHRSPALPCERTRFVGVALVINGSAQILSQIIGALGSGRPTFTHI